MRRLNHFEMLALQNKLNRLYEHWLIYDVATELFGPDVAYVDIRAFRDDGSWFVSNIKAYRAEDLENGYPREDAPSMPERMEDLLRKDPLTERIDMENHIIYLKDNPTIAFNIEEHYNDWVLNSQLYSDIEPVLTGGRYELNLLTIEEYPELWVEE